jgi:hypothetical protein
MAQKEEWEMEWRSVFEDKLSPSPTSPSKPTAKMVSHGLANTLDRIFRNYSPPSEGSSVRIMPAGCQPIRLPLHTSGYARTRGKVRVCLLLNHFVVSQ